MKPTIRFLTVPRFYLLILLSVFYTAGASAFIVNFDPGAYAGSYHNTQTWVTGPSLVDLGPGTHIIYIGTSNGTRFDVDAAGELTTDSSLVAVAGNTLLFNPTVPVHFDPQGYTGSYHNAQQWVTGPSTVGVMPAGTGSQDFGAGTHHLTFPGSGNSTQFDVAPNGNVITDSSRVTVSGVNTLVFGDTVPVHFDPGTYVGGYHNAAGWVTGPSTADLIPEGTGPRDFGIGTNLLTYPGHGNATAFDIDPAGAVTTDSSRVSVVGPNTLVFGPPTPVNFDPGEYEGGYHNVINWVRGPSSVELMAAGTRPRDFGNGTNLLTLPGLGNATAFDLDSGGGVTTDSSRVTVDGFNTLVISPPITVHFDPGTYTDSYHNTINWFKGPSSAGLVPAGTGPADFGTGRYLITNSALKTGFFDLSSPCHIEPTTVIVDGDIFMVNCQVNQPPVANAGADQIVEQQDPTGADVTLDGSGSSDPETDPLSFNWFGAFGTASGVSPAISLPVGNHTISLIVNDGTVNSAPDSVSITVRDSTPPSLTVPSDIVTEATGQQTAVAIGEATASDASGAVGIDNDAPSTFPLGTTTVTWTATDAAGNTATATQRITVRDSAAPSFDLTHLLTELWPPSGQMVLAATLSGVTDSVDNDPDVSITVTSNQGGSSDWIVTESGGNWSVELRAKRTGNGGDRWYNIAVSVTDAAGNIASAQVTVVVPHDQGRKNAN